MYITRVKKVKKYKQEIKGKMQGVWILRKQEFTVAGSQADGTLELL